MMAKPFGIRPSRNRWKNAGSSFRRVRSPDAPKITIARGMSSCVIATPSPTRRAAGSLLTPRRDAHLDPAIDHANGKHRRPVRGGTSDRLPGLEVEHASVDLAFH